VCRPPRRGQTHQQILPTIHLLGSYTSPLARGCIAPPYAHMLVVAGCKQQRPARVKRQCSNSGALGFRQGHAVMLCSFGYIALAASARSSGIGLQNVHAGNRWCQ